MKLLFVTHWANNMLIFRTFLLQEAVRQGHEVVVLCPPDTEAARFAELGVKHVPWSLRRGSGVGNLLGAILDARRVLRQEQPDATVVYCVQPIMALLWAWKLGGRCGKLFPTFTGLGSLWTDLDPAPVKKRLLRNLVERVFGWLLPQATKVFVLNRDDKVQVAGWNPISLLHKVEQTLGEGVDLDHFTIPTLPERHAVRARWGIPIDAKVIGFVGRLIREKGAPDFLELCETLREEERVHFLVVGDPDPGNPTSLSKKEMDELDAVPRMHREPWMTDVRSAYAAMDVLVFPSRYREGLPVTPLEAMAMGVQVIAYDSVGIREAIPTKWLTFNVAGFALNSKTENPNDVRVYVRSFNRKIIQNEYLSMIGASK